MNLGKNQILEFALAELKAALPGAREARLVKSHVLKEPMATFSPTPEIDLRRPPAATELANLFLAGDWTQTGWPATMEGAVRGGYLAAEGVLRADGKPKRLLVPGLRSDALALVIWGQTLFSSFSVISTLSRTWPFSKSRTCPRIHPCENCAQRLLGYQAKPPVWNRLLC
jgi:hypothetical protein